jgi:hypothetical protein
VTALAYPVSVDGVQYAAGTDSASMPAGVADKIRNPNAWVGGVAPALTATPDGKTRIAPADMLSATKAKAALGIEVSLLAGHIVPTGSAPTAAAQAGAGTSATATVSGRDTAGVITLTAGSANVAAGNQVIVTFNKPYPVAPVVQVAAQSAAGAALHPYVAATSTTTFTVALGSAPSTTVAYPISYVVVGK